MSVDELATALQREYGLDRATALRRAEEWARRCAILPPPEPPREVPRMQGPIPPATGVP